LLGHRSAGPALLVWQGFSFRSAREA